MYGAWIQHDGNGPPAGFHPQTKIIYQCRAGCMHYGRIQGQRWLWNGNDSSFELMRFRFHDDLSTGEWDDDNIIPPEDVPLPPDAAQGEFPLEEATTADGPGDLVYKPLKTRRPEIGIELAGRCLPDEVLIGDPLTLDMVCNILLKYEEHCAPKAMGIKTGRIKAANPWSAIWGN